MNLFPAMMIREFPSVPSSVTRRDDAGHSDGFAHLNIMHSDKEERHETQGGNRFNPCGTFSAFTIAGDRSTFTAMSLRSRLHKINSQDDALYFCTQPFDPGARKEIRDRRRKQRANLGFAALHVDADGTGKHPSGKSLHPLFSTWLAHLALQISMIFRGSRENPSLPGSRATSCCEGLGTPSLPIFSRSPKRLLLQKGFSVVTVCWNAFMSSSHMWILEGGILLPR
jgi:hypothetical protein